LPQCAAPPRPPPPFPTRRSSDLPFFHRSGRGLSPCPGSKKPHRPASPRTVGLHIARGDRAATERTVAGVDGGSTIRLSDSRGARDRKSTRLNSSHQIISYAVFCL